MDDELLTLARLARLLERACGELQPPLTLAQYRLLAMIGSGADRASRLAGQLALAKPTVSATVDTLVERGLVKRGSSRHDRAVTTSSPTPRPRCGRGSTTCWRGSTSPTRCRACSPRCAAGSTNGDPNAG